MKYIPLSARIFLSLPFLYAGINHLLGFSGFVDLIAQKLPLAPLLAIGTIVFQLLGALFLVIGYRVKVATTLLIVFLIPASLVFHNFITDPSQINNFLKNMGLMGGLLLIFYTGAGAVSVEGRIAKSKSPRQ